MTTRAVDDVVALPSKEPVDVARGGRGAVRPETIDHAPSEVEALVASPLRARAAARGVTIAFVMLALFAGIAPWRQTIVGSGRVVAYGPLERRQVIEAPISGRVVEWFVREGTAVREGDPIVRLSDNDPELLARLEQEEVATRARLDAYQARVRQLESRAAAVERSTKSAVEAAKARKAGADQRVLSLLESERAAAASLDTAQRNLERRRSLAADGLESQRELELALLGFARAETEVASAAAAVRAGRADVESRRADVLEAEAKRDAEIENARASVESAKTDVESTRGSLLRLEAQIARQRQQLVRAPRAGTVLQLAAAAGTEQIKEGEPLAVLVPDTSERAVELVVDGNDAAILTAGRPVRIQFEGWPAVQFTGWPSVAVGSFGGRVAFIDATDDGAGDFRVVVVPDPDDDPWPSTRYLRQGVRAQGWVLLEEVSVAYELWRQFNGFPPALEKAPPGAKDGAGKSDKGGPAS